MSSYRKSNELRIKHLLAGAEFMATRIGYVPDIDPDTRRILSALREDLIDCLSNMETAPDLDVSLCIKFMWEILENLLERTPENVRLTDNVLWMKSTLAGKTRGPDHE